MWYNVRNNVCRARTTEGVKMKNSEIKAQLLTIPNLLTLIRFLSIPFYVWCIVDPKTYLTIGGYNFPLIGLLIMVFAASTDLFDGWIARKFNQGTALGAALDPFADKFMHISAILALTIMGFVHWAFIVLIAFKEIVMIVGGLFILRYGQPIKANYWGKVASFTLSIGVFMSFFHAFWAEKVFYLDWIIIGIATVLTYCALISYLKQALAIIKKVFEAKKLGIDPNDYFAEEARKQAIANGEIVDEATENAEEGTETTTETIED